MLLLVLIAALTACGKKSPERVERVELGPPAHAFGLLKNVQLGMTVDEVMKAAPELKLDKDGRHASAFPEHATYGVGFANGRASLIRIQIMSDTRPEQELWKAWGPGVKMRDINRHRFLDEARGVRADLEEAPSHDNFIAELAPYTPLAKVLAGPDPYSLMGVQILGRPIDEVAADLRAQHLTVKVDKKDTETTAEVSNIPETEWSGNTRAGTMSADLRVSADGKVTGWTLSNVLFEAPDSVKQQLMTFYTTKWGTPKTEGTRHLFGTGPTVTIDDAFMSPIYSMTPAPF
jgi:hypothetical protein